MNESIIKDPLFIREKIGNYRSSTFMLADNVTEVNSLADIHDVHIRAIHNTKIAANEIIAEQSCIIRKLMMRVVNDTQKIDMLQRRLLDNGNMYKK
jgi:hypothetical protein